MFSFSANFCYKHMVCEFKNDVVRSEGLHFVMPEQCEGIFYFILNSGPNSNIMIMWYHQIPQSSYFFWEFHEGTFCTKSCFDVSHQIKKERFFLIKGPIFYHVLLLVAREICLGNINPIAEKEKRKYNCFTSCLDDVNGDLA